jgi:alpha-glucosidase (family GH31 glycosyl hydrolase)
MAKQLTRRATLGGMAIGAANLLFSRTLTAAVLGGQRDVPAVGNAHLLTVVAVSGKTLRLRVIQQGKHGPAEEVGVIPRVWPETLPVNESGEATWGEFKVRLTDRPWRISVVDADGHVRQEIRLNESTGAIAFQTGEGRLFGLGEGGHPLNRRGTNDAMVNGQHSPDLATYGARSPIPWLVSTDGWGIFLAHPWGTFDLTGQDGSFLPTEETPTRDIFLVLAKTPAELMKEWAELTGYPHMPPLWSLGFQQSHRTLASPEAVLAEAKRFRAEKLPCDAMIYLGTGFCPAGWNTGHGSFFFNPKIFPDPATMFHQMHEENFKIVLHVVSCPEDLHGEVGDAGAALADPSSAAVYWQTHHEVWSKGVDGWWPDEGDELPPASRLARNRMYWDGSQVFRPNVRPFALHRNGYAGMQRYAWLWSGDTLSTWKTLAAQVMGGITAGLCGIPYWGTDTGGFVPTKEFTAELFVRWFQFSSFSPSFRCHGRTWMLRLPWGWDMGNYGPAEFDGQFAALTLPKPEELHDKAVEVICRKYLNLRYQLLPYLYSSVAQTHRTGMPLMRSLWLDFPHDPKAAAVEDSYLWGDSILVAPVLESGAASRSVYLPRGAWWDYWKNARLQGGVEVMREVDLETMPLFVRAGAILPLGPVKQHTGEVSDEPLLLRVYPGADGTMTLYEDDGKSFDYEKGAYSSIVCSWEERSRTLSLGADTRGSVPRGRMFTVEIVDSGERKRFTMTGHAASIKL